MQLPSTISAMVYSALGDQQQALQYFEQALTLRRQAEDKDGRASTLNDIGLVYDALGDRQQALDFYEQALTLEKQVGGKDGGAATLNNIGVWSTLHWETSSRRCITTSRRWRSLRQMGDKVGDFRYTQQHRHGLR